MSPPSNGPLRGVMPYWVGFFMTALLMCGPFALWGYWPGFVGALTLVALVRAIVSLQVLGDFRVELVVWEVPEASIYGRFSDKLGPETPLER